MQKNNVPILEKAIEILEYMGAYPGRVSQTELQKVLGVSQSTCYRILATLERYGWVNKMMTRDYDISVGMVPIVRKVLNKYEPYRELEPTLVHLCRQIGFSTKISIRENLEQVNVVNAKAPWDLALTTQVGTRSSLLEGGSVGVIFFSTLPEDELRKTCRDQSMFKLLKKQINAFKRDGYAFNPASTDENYPWHVDAISVPIKDPAGEKITAVLTALGLPGAFRKVDIPNLAATMNKSAVFCTEYFI